MSYRAYWLFSQMEGALRHAGGTGWKKNHELYGFYTGLVMRLNRDDLTQAEWLALLHSFKGQAVGSARFTGKLLPVTRIAYGDAHTFYQKEKLSHELHVAAAKVFVAYWKEVNGYGK